MSLARSWPSISAAARTAAAAARGGSPQTALASRCSAAARGGAGWPSARRLCDPERYDGPMSHSARPCRQSSVGRGRWRRALKRRRRPPRAGDPGLPPGPRMPRALQTAIWSRQAQWMLEQCRARFGDMFTLQIAYEGTWVMRLRPGGGQAGLHRRPEGLPRRRGQPDPAPDPRRQLAPGPRREAAHRASASCCCRPSTASGCRATARR